MARVQIVFAAKDPPRLAAFWREALGYAAEPPPPGFESWEEFARANNIPLTAADIDSAVDPDGTGPRLLFERDDPHQRGAVHLDVNASSRETPMDQKRAKVNATVERLIKAGATKTRVVDKDQQYWVELTDPEGNWFCVQ
jgi:glyoxalase superfamily protein